VELGQTRYGRDARSLRWHKSRILYLPPDSMTRQALDLARPETDPEFVELEPQTRDNTFSGEGLKAARPDLFVVKEGD